MLKAIVFILQVIVGIYCLGNMARQNPKFDAFLILLEDGYGRVNEKVKETNVKDGVEFLKKIYGYMVLVFFLLLLIGNYLALNNEQYTFIFTIGFCISLLGLGGVSWCFQHKKMVAGNLRIVLLIVVSPFFLAFLESQSEVSLLGRFSEPLLNLLEQLGFSKDLNVETWTLAFMISAILLGMIIVQHVFAWGIFIPILLLNIIIVVLIINFAKLVNIFAPKKAFSGLMAAMFVFLMWLQYYAL